MRDLKFILSGGGTGGHIYPAVAIADELKRRHPKAEFLFVGAQDRMEMEKVPEAGYPIRGLWIAGIQRKLSLKNFILPFKLLKSLWEAASIVKEFKPDVVIGTGGYASGPVLRAANKAKLPTVLQEQNSYAGIANKWLAKGASKICVAYENMETYFPKEKLVFTGNPVRAEFLDAKNKREEAFDFFELDPAKKVLLVLGGSLGAKRINEITEQNLEYFKEHQIQLIWQCGKFYIDRYKKYNEEGILVKEFLYKMDLAYAAADIVVSRSGALSVSELCLVGKPVVFIPSPNVAEDHQTKNAKALADKDAALVVKESDLEEQFNLVLDDLLKDEELQKKLSDNIRKMAKPMATSDIVDQIEALIKQN